ncbi:TetR family transcriptional regulator C-terminal domain-containing protein [Brevibacterium sp. GP-SGM9]|uniref:TetR family transcriptional regulator C-terminal domain-containing protein n=1 Tax=Brevibacterium sp. GP-SGM9 TaxID=3376990 RepID=UPI0039A43FAB
MHVQIDSQATSGRAKDAILRSGLSQRRIAAAIGIDETKLSKSLAGNRRFTAEELFGLATSTGVTVRWLLGDESEVSAAPSRTPSVPEESEAAEATPRRYIVEIAWDLFARLGYEAVRIADIAEAAGVSSASVHYYFSSKSDLFDATLDHSVKLAFDRQIAWLSGIRNPRRRLERLLELQSPIGRTSRSEWSIWVQTWARLSLEGADAAHYLESYERWSTTVRRTIADGQDQGLFRAGDAAAMTDELTSLLDGLGVKVLTGVLDASTFRMRLANYLDRTITEEHETKKNSTDEESS